MGTPPSRSVLLVPFDGSEPAEAIFPYIPLLASDSCEIVLLQVVPEVRAVHGPLGDEIFSARELQRSAEAQAGADLARASERLRDLAPGRPVEALVTTGDPAERIIETAEQVGARMILLSAQGESATGRHGFSSVAGRIVSASPVPVMVVRPTFGAPNPQGIGRILLPYDGSGRASRAFPLAVDLARRIGAPVHLVTVVEDEETALPSGHGAAIDPRRRMEASADTLNRARRHLESTGATLLRQGIPASWEVLTGPAAAAILTACDARDLLLITSHGRTGSRWVMGSVAEKLVREAPVPVVLMRTPPGPQEQSA